MMNIIFVLSTGRVVKWPYFRLWLSWRADRFYSISVYSVDVWMVFAAFLNLRVTANGFFQGYRQWPCALGDWAAGHSAEPRSSHQYVNEVSASILFPVRQYSCLMNVTWICGEERIVSFTVEVLEWWLGTCIWKLMNNAARVGFYGFSCQLPSCGLIFWKVIFILISVYIFMSV